MLPKREGQQNGKRRREQEDARVSRLYSELKNDFNDYDDLVDDLYPEYREYKKAHESKAKPLEQNQVDAKFINILDYFRIDAEKWNRLQEQFDADRMAQLKNYLLELFELANDIALKQGKKLSSYELINWQQLLMDPANQDLSAFLNPLLNKMAQKADTSMVWVYLIFNLIDLGLICLTNVDFKSANLLKNDASPEGSIWNFWDSLGGFALGLRQIKQGEMGMGVANCFSGAQLMGCTIGANIAEYTSLTSLGATAISGLMGFSFAAGMVISGAIEYYEATRCTRRIELLEKQKEIERKKITDLELELKKLEETFSAAEKECEMARANYKAAATVPEEKRPEKESGITKGVRDNKLATMNEALRKSEASLFELRAELNQKKEALNELRPKVDNKCRLIDRAITIEAANRAYHERSASSWTACAVVMTAVACVAYFGLSAVTLGGFPIATFVVGFLAVMTGVARKWWVNRVDHVANARAGLFQNNKPDVPDGSQGGAAPLPGCGR
jgi:hypothetical protein